MTRILIIDNDANRRTAMASELREQGLEVSEQSDLILDTLSAADAIVAVDEMIIEALNSVTDLAPTILLSATPSVKASVAALQAVRKIIWHYLHLLAILWLP